jgi:hypothetical protein
MIRSSAPQESTVCTAREAASPWLVDDFDESYVCWREAADAAKDAYEHWTGVDGEADALAFAAYRAALDREEAAARTYRDCAERVAGRAL